MDLKKVDRRMIGYGNFSHVVDFRSIWSSEFIIMRQWCFETWGPTIEVDLWANSQFQNPSWSWYRNKMEKTQMCKIFLAGEKEVAWWRLRWD